MTYKLIEKYEDKYPVIGCWGAFKTSVCKKCGWHIYADLEDHYWEDRRDHRIPERMQHKDCYERQKQ